MKDKADFLPKLGKPFSKMNNFSPKGTAGIRALQMYQDMRRYLEGFKLGIFGPKDGYTWDITDLTEADIKHLKHLGIPEHKWQHDIIMRLRTDYTVWGLKREIVRIRQQETKIGIGGPDAYNKY